MQVGSPVRVYPFNGGEPLAGQITAVNRAGTRVRVNVTEPWPSQGSINKPDWYPIGAAKGDFRPYVELASCCQGKDQCRMDPVCADHPERDAGPADPAEPVPVVEEEDSVSPDEQQEAAEEIPEGDSPFQDGEGDPDAR